MKPPMVYSAFGASGSMSRGPFAELFNTALASADHAGKSFTEAQKQLNVEIYLHTLVTKLQLHQLSHCGPYFKAHDPSV